MKDGVATQLKVFFAEKDSSILVPEGAAPGTVLSDGKNYLAITTSDGALSLKDIQLSGKKRMDVKAFLLGFRNPESYSVSEGTSKQEIARHKPIEDD